MRGKGRNRTGGGSKGKGPVWGFEPSGDSRRTEILGAKVVAKKTQVQGRKGGSKGSTVHKGRHSSNLYQSLEDCDQEID